MIKRTGSQERQPFALSGLLPYLIIIIFGLALYGRTAFFGFTFLDDSALILDNYPVISDLRNVGTVFSSDVFFSEDKSYYRPLLNVSLMLDAALGGAEPTVFHLTNILLHIIAACLVFLMFLKLGRSRGLSLFLSLLFLVHPVLSQAVAWIPGRNDVLLAIFVLSAWISFLNFSERPRLSTYLGYLFFFWLALLTKESALFLPAVVIIYFLWVQPARVNRPDRWLLAIGSGAVAFFWLLMRRFALGQLGGGSLAAVASLGANISALLVYIGKILLPVDLKSFPVLEDSRLIYGLIALPVLAICLWLSRHKRWPFLLLGVVWFLLFLLPSFIRLSGLPDFLEHRAYLPLIGFLIVMAEIDFIGAADWNARRAWLAGGAALVLLAGISFWHAGIFRERLAFWEAAAAGSPHSPLVQRNLGAMYYLQGEPSKAEEHYRLALDLNPREEMAHNNIGVIYLDQKKYEEAAAEFRQELEVNPGYDRALFNLGESYFRRGQTDEARRFWQAALSANPYNQEAYRRLLNRENPIQ